MPDHTNVRHDSTKRHPDECPAKCPVCNGTGFHNGKICVCITGKGQPEVPELLRQIFGVRK